MNFVKGLENETQILVAVGSAIAAGCIPCLEKITKMAREAGVEDKKLKAAALLGQFIKDQPANHMKAAADNLLGTHLQGQKGNAGCPAENGSTLDEDGILETGDQQSCSCGA